MKFLDSTHIDKKRWDELVTHSQKNNVFCYSWYLDATTEKWGAILDEDYSFGIPLPYKNRLFFKKIFQHPFSRNIEFFGDENKLQEAVAILLKLGTFNFHFNHHLELKHSKKVYQQIDFNQPVKYKKNATRIIEKNKDIYHYKISENSESILKFYFENSFNKIKQQQKNKVFLKQLITNAITNKKGELLELYSSDNQLIAAAFFLKDKQTVCYLIGDCNEENKKKGAMYVLMDFAIQYYIKDYLVFDFGGSSIESVATFYKKMGGNDVEYFEYKSK